MGCILSFYQYKNHKAGQILHSGPQNLSFVKFKDIPGLCESVNGNHENVPEIQLQANAFETAAIFFSLLLLLPCRSSTDSRVLFPSSLQALFCLTLNQSTSQTLDKCRATTAEQVHFVQRQRWKKWLWSGGSTSGCVVGIQARLQPVNGAWCVCLCICVSSTFSSPTSLQQQARTRVPGFSSLSICRACKKSSSSILTVTTRV